MCTVSIVSHRDGLRVMSNRDERCDRLPALEPRTRRFGSRTAAMPIDPVGGGSWIGVNDAGLVAVVLNRYHGPVRPLPANATSRGAIVPLALACDSVAAALSSVGTVEVTQFQPFRLVLVHGREIALVTADARQLTHVTAALERPCMFTASSLGDVVVDTPRRRLFEWLMNDADHRLRGQALFHRHQWADKRDISVLMEGADAATVSRTTVDVGPTGIALEYESLLPLRPPQRVEMRAC